MLFLSSADTSQERVGKRLWRKHLLRLSEWVHPNDPSKKLTVTMDVLRRLKENFDAGVLDFVPVPSRHTDDWQDNRGETLALDIDPVKGLYATVLVDEDTDRAIAEQKLRGVSAGFDPDYLDKESGRRIGPVLKHIALTNVPYIKGLEGFERTVNLSAADFPLVCLSEVTGSDVHLGASSTLRDANPSSSEASVTVEEAKALLKKEAQIDVDSLVTKAGEYDTHKANIETASRVRGVLREAGIVALSEDAPSDDVVKHVTELAEENKTLKKAARRAAAEAIVAPYLAAGKLDKAASEGMIELAEEKPELAKAALKGLSGNVLLGETGSSDGGEPGDLVVDGKVELSEKDAEAEAKAILERQRAAGAARRKATAAAAA